MVVLDTDFLIDVMRGDETAVAELESRLESYHPLTLSAITVMQLHHGVARSDKPAEERRQIANALSAATVHALDRDIAAKAGELDGRLTDEGTRIRAADTIIAATALHHGEPVLTNNVKHFSRIEGLDVHSYDTSSG